MASVRLRLKEERQTVPSILIDEDEAAIDLNAARESRDADARRLAEEERAAAVKRQQDQASWERLMTELTRVFQAQQTSAQAAPAPSKDSEAVAKKLHERFPQVESRGEEIVLSNPAGALSVTASRIAFVSAAAEEGETASSFTADDAYAMVLAASLNPAMVAKGIRLTGTDAQQSLILSAIEQVNATLPAESRLKIKGAAPMPAAAAAPVAPQPIDAPVANDSSDAAADVPEQTPAKRGFKNVFSGLASGVAAAVTKLHTPRRAYIDEDRPVAAANDAAAPQGRSNPTRRRMVAALGGAFAGAAMLNPNSAKAGFLDDLFGGPKPAAGEPLARAQTRYSGLRTKAPKRRKGESRKKFAKRQRQHQRAMQKADAQIRQEQRAEPRPMTKREQRKQQLQEQQAQRNFARQEQQPQQERASGGSREILFLDTHSDNTMVVNTGNIASCCGEFNRFARDRMNHQVINMDPRLLQYVSGVSEQLRSIGYAANEFQLISGYRSPETNAEMRRNGGRQAKDSQHCVGRALDIRVTGVPTGVLHQAACRVVGNQGGVGKYSGSAFVHMDTRGVGARWGV